MTSTTDSWILVSVPSRTAQGGDRPRLLERAAVLGGLRLLAWADRPRRAPRTVDLARVDRAAPAQRPFC